MIPKPLPFLRLGLANLPVMLAIDIMPLPSFFILVLIKILGQGLIGGTLFSYIFLFSAVGSISSALIMLFFKKIFPKYVSYIGISVAGAFSSNAAQLVLARFYIFGESAWYIAPPFVIAGVASGTLLGIFANRYAQKSRWYAEVSSGTIEHLAIETPGLIANPSSVNRFISSPVFRFIIGILLLITLMFSSSMTMQIIVVALAVILFLADTKHIKLLPVISMSASIILFNLLVPFGKVLATPFKLPITEGALLLGIKKALTVEGMIFISKWMLKPGFRLPGSTGMLVSQAFSILGHLSNRRKKIDPKNLIQSIDSIMYERD